jgi:hypothetical protein
MPTGGVVGGAACFGGPNTRAGKIDGRWPRIAIALTLYMQPPEKVGFVAVVAGN